MDFKKENLYVVKAKVHNLKNLSLTIPKDKLVVFTGVSGCGKSSLVFDTINAEGQYAYVNSLSVYAKRVLNLLEKPNVEKIINLSPTVSISQKTPHNNPRSIIGTLTDIYEYLKLLFNKIGTAYCVNGHGIIKNYSKNNINDFIFNTLSNHKIGILILQKVNSENLLNQLKILKNLGASRLQIKDVIYDIDVIIKNINNYINLKEFYILIDQLLIENNEDTEFLISEDLNLSWKLNTENEIIIESYENNKEYSFTINNCCNKCDYYIKELVPQNFSFNNPIGYCELCQGLGITFGANPKLLFDFNLSINDGGVNFFRNITKKNKINSLWQEFLALCKAHKIDLNLPINYLSEKEIDILLHGSKKKIKYVFQSKSFGKIIKNNIIEGLGDRLLRLYNSTQSTSARAYYKSYLTSLICSKCNGARVNKTAQYIKILNKNISDFCNLNFDEAVEFIQKIKNQINKYQFKIAKNLLDEIEHRIKLMIEIGLNYLNLSREAHSLSNGEYQRIRLSTQLGSRLTNIIYILDEPSIGLHVSDNNRLIKILHKIRDIGNSVFVIEHDLEIIKSANYIFELGPKAGINGGEIIDYGELSKIIKNNKCLTAKYINHDLKIALQTHKNKINTYNYLEIFGAAENNLKKLNVKFYLNCFLCISGVSGSGKSTLIQNILYPAIKRNLNLVSDAPGKHDKFVNNGVEHVVNITQKSIGRNIRSNPATYIQVFDEIRKLFAKKSSFMGFSPSHFSFNLKIGTCEKCYGYGEKLIEMALMPTISVKCDECDGKRYKKNVLKIYYKGHNIYDVLQLSFLEAHKVFYNYPKIRSKMQMMIDSGLGYLKLGQSAITLSGGESQRIKIVANLLKKKSKNTLYILDEPTTGLHSADVKLLLKILYKLIENNGSLIIIEHNLDILKNADYIIDMGPGAGDSGGKILSSGTPLDLINSSKSITGRYLKTSLSSEEKNIIIKKFQK